MLETLRHLLSADYLYALAPLAGGPRPLAVALWAAWWLGVCGSAWRWRARLVWQRRTPWAANLLGALGVLGALAVAAQVIGGGPASARIWALALAGLALAWPMAHAVAACRPPAWFVPVGRGLAADLAPGDPPVSPRWQAAWLLLHLAGIASLVSSGRPGAWALAVTPVCLAATVAAGGRVRTEVLAPLLLGYGAHLARAFLRGALGVETAPYEAFPWPDPWSLWFDGQTPLAIATAWMVLSTWCYLWRVRPRPKLLLGAASLASLGWWAALYARHLSHGATASDPFCYLQMAADLAQTGSPRHLFALAALGEAAGVPLWPMVPVGYHPPLDGWAATVWPVGWPALLAPFYWLGGETLAMWGAPAFLLLAAGLTYRLAQLALTGAKRHEALLTGLVASGVMLTSYEALTRSLTPMADAAVAALSAVVALALLRACRDDALGWTVVAGLALAVTYHVRHAQLPLVLAALPAYLWAPWPMRRRLRHLAVCGATAAVAALPDLAYHARAFGSPWVSESPEWFLLGPQHLAQAWSRLWEDGLWRRNEFGYLWPLVGCGLVAQLRSRSEKSAAGVLLAGFAGVLLFHLCYAAVRLRDLIGLFPWLALWAGRGVLAVWRWAQRGEHPRARRAAILLVLSAMLMARSASTLGLPLRATVDTFGRLSAAERAAFALLGDTLPPGAVLGADLNAGAIARYAGREAVRPSAWSPDEFDRFVRALAGAGRPLYLLVDGEEMGAWLPGVAARYGLSCQGAVKVPYFGRGGQRLGSTATLYLLSVPD